MCLASAYLSDNPACCSCSASVVTRYTYVLSRQGVHWVHTHPPQIRVKCKIKNTDTVHNAPCVEERSTSFTKKHPPFSTFFYKRTPPFHFLPTGLLSHILWVLSILLKSYKHKSNNGAKYHTDSRNFDCTWIILQHISVANALHAVSPMSWTCVNKISNINSKIKCASWWPQNCPKNVTTPFP